MYHRNTRLKMEHLINTYPNSIPNSFKMNLYNKLTKTLKMNSKIVKQRASTLVAVPTTIYPTANSIRVELTKVMDFRNIIICTHRLLQMMAHNVSAMIVKEINYCTHVHANGQKSSTKQFSKVKIGMISNLN